MSYTKEKINELMVDTGKPHIISKSECRIQKDHIDLYCLKHNYDFNTTLEKAIHHKYICKYCDKDHQQELKKQKNNLWNSNPNIAQLLANPKDAIGLCPHSHEKRWFICPNCKTRLYKSITNVSLNGLCCNICSDGFTYPNKLIFSILNSLNIIFEPEFCPSWSNYRRYDFYFVYKNQQIIIEIDGGLGHGNRVMNNSKYSIEETYQIDIEKDELAKQYGIKVIRIDAKESTIEYIKENLLKSELSNILPLNKVDWEQCETRARGSLLLKICEYYNKYPFLSYKQLSEVFFIKEDTLRKYLRIGAEKGLCPPYKHSLGKPVLCLESQIIFSTCTEAAEYYGLGDNRVGKCCNGRINSLSSLHFIWLDNYQGNIDELKPDYTVKPIRASEKHSINMYDKNFKYIKTYESVAEAARQNNVPSSSINSSCRSKHKRNNGKIYYYADDLNQPDKSRIILR